MSAETFTLYPSHLIKLKLDFISESDEEGMTEYFKTVAFPVLPGFHFSLMSCHQLAVKFDNVL